MGSHVAQQCPELASVGARLSSRAEWATNLDYRLGRFQRGNSIGGRWRARVIVPLLMLVWFLSAVSLQAATVTATWNANSETDIAGYKLSYGTQSGTYTTTIDVGNVTSASVTLNPGQYFFAVQAY